MSHFLQAIKDSWFILDLKDDWDEDGALAVKPECFNHAVLFLHLLYEHKQNIIAPTILPLRDGKVDISFRKDPYRLLLCCSDNNISCYGDNGNNGDVIKSGSIKFTDVFIWISDHMFI